MVANTRSTSAAAALVAILLSTTTLATAALAAVPEDAGMAVSVAPRTAPPEVRPLAQSAIQGQRFAAEDGRVLELLLADGTSLTLAPEARSRSTTSPSTPRPHRPAARDPGAGSPAGRGRPPGLCRAGGRDHACGRGQARPWRGPRVRRPGRHHPHRPPLRRPAHHDRGGRDRGSGPAGLRDGHDPRRRPRIAGPPARGRDRGRHGGAQPRPAWRRSPPAPAQPRPPRPRPPPPPTPSRTSRTTSARTRRRPPRQRGSAKGSGRSVRQAASGRAVKWGG